MSFALTVAVLAERFRQVAGRGSAPDWCPLTEDVPASAVLKEVAVPRWYGALLLGRLVGEAGLVWLRQEPVAMRELAACFGEGPSELRAIVVEAASRLTLRSPPPPRARTRIGRRRRQRIANRLRPRSNPSPSAARAPAGAGSPGSGRVWRTARSSRTRAAGCTTLPARRTSSCPTALPRSLRWRGWTRRP